MKHKLWLLISLVLGTGACNQMQGGPSDGDIIQVARDSMVASSATPEQKNQAAKADIKTYQMCNKQGDVFACGIKVKVDGAEEKIFIVEMRKDGSGKWVHAQ